MQTTHITYETLIQQFTYIETSFQIKFHIKIHHNTLSY